MLNGEFMQTDKPCLNYNNRGLMWGDSFSVQLRGNSCFVYDFDSYFTCIEKMAKTFGMENGKNFTPKALANDIYLLLRKNRIYKEFVVTITIFRESKSEKNEKVTDNNSFSTLLSVESLPHEFYGINKNGIFLDVLDFDSIAPQKTIPNFPFELLCGNIMKENNLDDLVITDGNGNYKRSIHSDIFFLKDNLLIYASAPDIISTNNVFASRIAELCTKNLKMKLDKKPVCQDTLKNVDGMFLADPINGIRWVVGLGKNRFYRDRANDIAYEIYNYYKTEIERQKSTYNT